MMKTGHLGRRFIDQAVFLISRWILPPGLLHFRTLLVAKKNRSPVARPATNMIVHDDAARSIQLAGNSREAAFQKRMFNLKGNGQ